MGLYVAARCLAQGSEHCKRHAVPELAYAVEVDYSTFHHCTDSMSNVSILCEQLYDMNRDMPTMTGKATYTRCHLIRTLFAVRQLVLPVKFFQVPAHML